MVDSVWSLLLAGILVGLFGIFFESLMGVQPPVIDAGPVAQTKEHLFSLGSVPIYIPTTTQPEPELEPEPQPEPELQPEPEADPEPAVDQPVPTE